MANIIIYTDGSSRGNPGKGGYGVVLISGENRKELSEGYKKTTNNRMELLAVIIALEIIKGEHHSINIYSDSKYVVDSIKKKWVFGWERKKFKNKKNVDLWERFLKIYYNQKQKIKFNWIKGHSLVKENERCDFLAVEASKKTNLKIDVEYEKTSKDIKKLF